MGGARVGAGRVKGGDEKLQERIKESVFHPCLSEVPVLEKLNQNLCFTGTGKVLRRQLLFKVCREKEAPGT
jgi:hypothetical protein